MNPAHPHPHPHPPRRPAPLHSRATPLPAPTSPLLRLLRKKKKGKKGKKEKKEKKEKDKGEKETKAAAAEFIAEEEAADVQSYEEIRSTVPPQKPIALQVPAKRCRLTLRSRAGYMRR